MTRTQARLLLVGLALCCAWTLALGGGESAPPTAGAPGDYSDVKLYRDIAAAVAGGQDYYAAATALHRAHGFPTVPFFTVRLPTLASAAAAVGWPDLRAALAALLIAGVFAWYARLQGRVSKTEQIAVAVLMLLGGAMVAHESLAAQHDQWVGLLLTLALPFRGGRTWPMAVVCAATALAIRELALAFVLLALAFTLFERRWREAAAWAALVVAFAIGMALHAQAVGAHVLPGDLVSPGWNGLRGPAGTIAALAEVSLLNALPLTLAALLIVLALFGWAGAPRQVAVFALLWLSGFGAAIALFGRPDTTYWAIELVPAWFLGLAFLPRALNDLRTAAVRS